MNGLDLAAGTGIILQVLKIGDLFLTPGQKRQVQDTAENVTLRLAYLEPLQKLRKLNTTRGRAALALVSALELSIEQLIPIRHNYVGMAMIFFSGVSAVFLAFRVRSFSRIFSVTLDYFFEPLLPCFDGIPGRLQAGVKGIFYRGLSVGVGSAMLVAALGSVAGYLFHLRGLMSLISLPFAAAAGLFLLFFLPIANTVMILQFALAITFALEFVVKLLRALAWRVVAYGGGAHGAIVLLVTTAITVWAVVLRVKY